MKTYYSRDFTGHYPVGTALVVSASTVEDAREKADAECKHWGLSGFDGTLEELNEHECVVLCNGDY